MSAQSPSFSQTSFWDIPNAISSLGSVGGPFLSDLQSGLKMNHAGLDHAHSSPSQSPVKGLEIKTNVTCGPCSPISSASVGLQSLLESRLRARLGENGSPEYVLIWKHWDMQSGPPICALRASAPRTSGKDFSGWPTPISSEARQGFQDRSRGMKGTQESLTTQTVNQIPYPPPTGKPVWVVNAKQQGLEGHAGNGHSGNKSGWIIADSLRSATEAGDVGFWSECELVPCRDGKTRRTERGVCPLADGLPGRVGLLRGYGNAIVPQVAAEFIRAYKETLT